MIEQIIGGLASTAFWKVSGSVAKHAAYALGGVAGGMATNGWSPSADDPPWAHPSLSQSARFLDPTTYMDAMAKPAVHAAGRAGQFTGRSLIGALRAAPGFAYGIATDIKQGPWKSRIIGAAAKIGTINALYHVGKEALSGLEGERTYMGNPMLSQQANNRRSTQEAQARLDASVQGLALSLSKVHTSRWGVSPYSPEFMVQ